MAFVFLLAMDTRADAHRNLEANIVNSVSVSWICNFYMNRYIDAVENLMKEMYKKNDPRSRNGLQFWESPKNYS